ncbi:nucleotide exchange factor GrpE [Deltaproteobacteria bacterium OttesenSCG-928-M10]|nr:nucleotide exchange factor GrpE [Deltaproteobacteria bacterium OttesenSCG-928-M10]
MIEEKMTPGPEEQECPAEAPAEPEEKNWPEEAKKFQDLYLRNAAETENMRRRFQKEREEQSRYAAERIVKGLLPVMDNLHLALDYVREDSPAEAKSLAEGVRMTLKGFQDVMADNGVREVPAGRGVTFDPNLHEALGQVPDAEVPAGAISQEIQKGYTLFDRLVRPAKVIVASAAG